VYHHTQERTISCDWPGWSNDAGANYTTVLKEKLYELVLPRGVRLSQDANANHVCHVQWSVIDSLYFTMATISTVGYGDLSPSIGDPAFVVFNVVYIIGGLIVAFPRLSAAITALTRPFFLVTREAIERSFPQKAIDIVRRPTLNALHAAACARAFAGRCWPPLAAAGRRCRCCCRTPADGSAASDTGRQRYSRLQGAAPPSHLLLEGADRPAAALLGPPRALC
jgi:hypothetical protein